MVERPWLASYPPGVVADIAPDARGTLVDMLEHSFKVHARQVAYHFLGRDVRYADLDSLSQALAAYLQGLGLAKGDRVAVMLPNVAQYPVAVAAIWRAGMVVVNVNPLYTPHELQHQLKDAGAKAIFVMEKVAATLARCVAATPISHVVLCAMGDQLGLVRGGLVNHLVRNVNKQVPPYRLPAAVRFNVAVARGTKARFQNPGLGPDDIALLQYTGGTTGVSKAAVLLHRNLVANVRQCEAWNRPVVAPIAAQRAFTAVCALPLGHIFAFSASMLLSLCTGAKLILVADARDLDGMLKTLRAHTVHGLAGVHALFQGLLNHPDFARVDWQHLKLTIAGGAAVPQPVARRWAERTGCPICEGYGLSETSPTVSCNPVTTREHTGSVGLPLPGTWVKLIDNTGQEVAVGTPGELVVKGPQVMAGYWQRPDETAKVMRPDGYLCTGDIGVMDVHGFLKIVDRKKDMLQVGGFHVFPTELEQTLQEMPAVREAACVGVPDAKTGEAVKLFIVKSDDALTETQVRAFCQEHLATYKQPRFVEFREALPKTATGKILRRALRNH